MICVSGKLYKKQSNNSLNLLWQLWKNNKWFTITFFGNVINTFEIDGLFFRFSILIDCNNKCFHWKWMRVNFDKFLLFLDAVASQVFAPVSHWQTPHHLPKFKPPHWLSHACYILVDLIQFVTDHCRRF